MRTMHPLIEATIRDLVIDVRCAERDSQREYAASTRRILGKLWRARFTATIGRYGAAIVDGRSIWEEGQPHA